MNECPKVDTTPALAPGSELKETPSMKLENRFWNRKSISGINVLKSWRSNPISHGTQSSERWGKEEPHPFPKKRCFVFFIWGLHLAAMCTYLDAKLELRQRPASLKGKGQEAPVSGHRCQHQPFH